MFSEESQCSSYKVILALYPACIMGNAKANGNIITSHTLKLVLRCRAKWVAPRNKDTAGTLTATFPLWSLLDWTGPPCSWTCAFPSCGGDRSTHPANGITAERWRCWAVTHHDPSVFSLVFFFLYDFIIFPPRHARFHLPVRGHNDCAIKMVP